MNPTFLVVIHVWPLRNVRPRSRRRGCCRTQTRQVVSEPCGPNDAKRAVVAHVPTPNGAMLNYAIQRVMVASSAHSPPCFLDLAPPPATTIAGGGGGPATPYGLQGHEHNKCGQLPVSCNTARYVQLTGRHARTPTGWGGGGGLGKKGMFACALRYHSKTRLVQIRRAPLLPQGSQNKWWGIAAGSNHTTNAAKINFNKQMRPLTNTCCRDDSAC